MGTSFHRGILSQMDDGLKFFDKLTDEEKEAILSSQNLKDAYAYLKRENPLYK